MTATNMCSHFGVSGVVSPYELWCYCQLLFKNGGQNNNGSTSIVPDYLSKIYVQQPKVYG